MEGVALPPVWLLIGTLFAYEIRIVILSKLFRYTLFFENFTPPLNNKRFNEYYFFTFLFSLSLFSFPFFTSQQELSENVLASWMLLIIQLFFHHYYQRTLSFPLDNNSLLLWARYYIPHHKDNRLRQNFFPRERWSLSRQLRYFPYGWQHFWCRQRYLNLVLFINQKDFFFSLFLFFFIVRRYHLSEW